MKKLSSLILISFCIYAGLNAFCASGGQSIVVGISLNAKLITNKHDTVCNGSYFQLSASNISAGGMSGVPVYQWTNIDSSITVNTQSVVSSVIGRWVATIKYYNGVNNGVNVVSASASDTIFIAQYPIIPFTFVTSKGLPISGTNITVCGGDDSIFGATPGFKDYKWYKNSSTNLIDTTPLLIITPQLLAGTEGTVFFYITAKDKNGCDAHTAQNIRRDVSVCVNLGSDTTTCIGQPVTISSPCSPWGLIGYKYVWSTGATTPTITEKKAGTYWLAITSLSKCTFRDTMKIFQNPTPVISATKDSSICFGTTEQLNAKVITGNGPFTYLWTSGQGLSSTSINNPIATPTGQGTFTYSLQVKDPIGCTGDTSLHITVLSAGNNPYFAINPGKDTTICFKSSAQLNPSVSFSAYPATYTWSWSPATGLNNTNTQHPVASLSSAGIQTYYITATDNRGCKKSDSVKIKSLTPLMLATNFTDSSLCINKSAQVNASASGSYNSASGYSYSCTPSTGSSSGSSIILSANSKTAIYTITAKDSLGCASNNVTVTLHGISPFVHVINGPDTTGYKGTPMVLNAVTTSGTFVQWFDKSTGNLVGTGNSYTTSVSEDVYTTVSDTIHGCMISDTVSVIISDVNPYVIFIPNIFSPDAANEENKTLKVFGNQIQENNFSFRIYNQWGQLVYQTTSFAEANTKGWPGELQGSTQSNNVYTYTVEGKFYDGRKFSKAGTSTIVQ